MCGYRQLLLWRQAYALTSQIHGATEDLAGHDQDELTASLRRESLSIAVQIAVEYSADGRTFLQGLNRARRSVVCVEHLIYLAQYLDYWPVSRTVSLLRQLADIRRQLYAFIHTIAREQPEV